MKFLATLALALLLTSLPSRSDAAVITFETLTDFDAVSAQFPGLTFSNAIVLTAGISLNEVDFPPHSGTNVVFDTGGSMTISFTSSVASIGGYFTYVVPLTLTAYDSAANILGTVQSAHSANFVGSAQGSPNELLQFSSLIGISSISIAGASLGSSFTMDDFTYETVVESVPEPGSLALITFGIAALIAGRKRFPPSIPQR